MSGLNDQVSDAVPSVLATPTNLTSKPWPWVGVVLIVLVWVVLLIGGFSMVKQAREASHRTRTRGHMKQIGLAMHNFHDAHRHFPPLEMREGEQVHSWMTDLLPYLNQQSLHNGIARDLAWNDAANKASFSVVVPQYQNLSVRHPTVDANGYALTHFAANSRIISPDRRMRVADIRDGTSNTFLVGMVETGFRPWGDPTNHRDPAAGVTGGPHAFGSPRANGILVLWADGSVRVLPQKIDPHVFQQLGDPADGQRIPDEAFELR